MDGTIKKMMKVMDELVVFFLSAGSEDVKLDLKRHQNSLELIVESGYQKSERKKIRDLDRYLNVTERNVGLEEFSWQLAGVGGLEQEMELQLIGQMVDDVKLDIGEDSVRLSLTKGF